MTMYVLCRHYDSNGGDDTHVIGLFSTLEKAYEEGKKWEKTAVEAYEKQDWKKYGIPKPAFTGMFAGTYGDYYVKTMDVDKETI